MNPKIGLPGRPYFNPLGTDLSGQQCRAFMRLKDDLSLQRRFGTQVDPIAHDADRNLVSRGQ